MPDDEDMIDFEGRKLPVSRMEELFNHELFSASTEDMRTFGRFLERIGFILTFDTTYGWKIIKRAKPS